MRALQRQVNRSALALALIAVSSGLAAQDYPILPPQLPPAEGPEITIPLRPPEAEEPALPVEPLAPPPPVPLHLLDRFVLPGTRVRLEWEASQSFAGSEVAGPVIVAHGAESGPVLCLTAGVHGDEINGVEIVRRVIYALNPEALRGTVIAVPVVNLFGYARGTRYLPDRRDLNRYFPGTRYGSIASRIAHGFFTEIVRHCDSVVDFHTGSFDRSNLPQVRADLTRPEVLEFTRGFGATVVLHSPGAKGMLRAAATEAGIPAVTFEVGAPARIEPTQIAIAVDAIGRLMHNLGLTDSAAVANEEPQPIFYESQWVRANGGGLLISDVELGQRVTRGQRLGRVVDPLRNTEREILSPLFGRVIGMAQNQQVLPGFAAYHLGEETSEQQAVQEAAVEGGQPLVPEDEGGAPPPVPGESGEESFEEDFE